jgi:hypothetical protein
LAAPTLLALAGLALAGLAIVAVLLLAICSDFAADLAPLVLFGPDMARPSLAGAPRVLPAFLGIGAVTFVWWSCSAMP